MLAIIYFAALIFVGYQNLLFGWLLLIPPCAFLLVLVVGALLERPAAIPELSPAASKLLRTFYLHFSLPNTFAVYSRIAVLSWVCALTLATLGIVRGSWPGVPLALSVLVIMGTIANLFNPKYWIALRQQQAAYEEAFRYWVYHDAKRSVMREDLQVDGVPIVRLESDYLKVDIAPRVGGRVIRVMDKSSGFLWRNNSLPLELKSTADEYDPKKNLTSHDTFIDP